MSIEDDVALNNDEYWVFEDGKYWIRKRDKVMDGAELQAAIELHELWLANDESGKRLRLQEVNLQNVDLRGVNLQEAYLVGANLKRASLEGANLKDAHLWRTNLQGANLQKAYLQGAYLKDVNFQYAHLQGANLHDANLKKADLRNADLRDVHLQDADLGGADLQGVNLQGAYLRGANLLCFGNMKEVRTMQIEEHLIAYTADTLQICRWRLPISEWRNWSTTQSRSWFGGVSEGLRIMEKHLPVILQIIDTFPAVPTGHPGE